MHTKTRSTYEYVMHINLKKMFAFKVKIPLNQNIQHYGFILKILKSKSGTKAASQK